MRSLPSEVHRTRILAAMVQVASERGPEYATVARVIARARVSRKSFYDQFGSRDDCLDAVFDMAVERAAQRASATDDPQARWAKRIRTGLSAILELIDEEPELAAVCVAHGLAHPATVNGRMKTLDQLTRLIDEGRAARRSAREPPPLAAQGVLGSALGLVYARLIAHDTRPFLELLNPLMSIIVLPYLGAATAKRELTHPVPSHPPRMRKRPPTHPEGLDLRLTYRTIAVLEAVAAEPHLSNREVAGRAGITDAGQVSKLLKRIAALGLVENVGGGQVKGASNAWRLTGRGDEFLRSLGSLR